jgi:phospholipid/cholesterol/gamma-HCH transport system ATP-binding protein
MTDSQTILSFQSVTINPDENYDTAIWRATLQLAAGELALIKLEARQQLPICDAAVGLVEPDEGCVLFLGVDWKNLPPREAAAARGRTGRVFDDGGWISNLDIDENIALPVRHHSRRNVQELYDQAAELCQVFELPGLPRGRPNVARLVDLRRAACVRAFLGEPVLLILERPERDVYPDIMPPLLASIRSARNRGAAVLWLTAEAELWNEADVGANQRFIMSGSQMLLVPENLL